MILNLKICKLQMTQYNRFTRSSIKHIDDIKIIGHMKNLERQNTAQSSVTLFMNSLTVILKENLDINIMMTGVGLRPEERSSIYTMLFDNISKTIYAIDKYNPSIIFEVKPTLN